MVRFKLPNSAAVAAAMPVPFEERQPLGERVMTFSSELAGAAQRPNHTNDLRVPPPISENCCFDSIAIPGVVVALV